MHEQIDDFLEYCPSFLKILTKDGRLIPFELNSYQRLVAEILLKAFDSFLPVRVIILKGRQMGISTVIAAFFFWLVSTRPNMKHILIADISSRTDDVFNMYRRFLDNLDPEMRPLVNKNNEREISFENPNERERYDHPGLRSRIVGETAQDKAAGRGSTCQSAHKTECAYYPYAGEIDKGLGNSILLGPETVVVEESTANGVAGHGGHFFSRWTQAVAGLNGFIPIFIPWWEASEYELNADHFEITDDERELNRQMAIYSKEWKALPGEVKARKFAWRRAKIAEFAADTATTYSPEEVFDQEFPWCPEVAFIASGNPVFDVSKIRNQITGLVANPKPIIDVTKLIKKTVLEDYSRGLKIYRLPKNKTEAFVIAGDVAEGLEGGDSSHAVVLDSKLKEVACWHGSVDPDLFGAIMVSLGLIYNGALLAPEINSMGHTTLATIKRLGYLRVYTRSEVDKITEKPTKDLGWRTTAANKNAMIGKLKAMHRDGLLEINDIEKLREMSAITRDASGYIEINGKDRVAALCIACEAFEQLPINDGGSFQQKEIKVSFTDTPENRRKVYGQKKKDSFFD